MYWNIKKKKKYQKRRIIDTERRNWELNTARLASLIILKAFLYIVLPHFSNYIARGSNDMVKSHHLINALWFSLIASAGFLWIYQCIICNIFLFLVVRLRLLSRHRLGVRWRWWHRPRSPRRHRGRHKESPSRRHSSTTKNHQQHSTFWATLAATPSPLLCQLANKQVSK